MINRDLQRNGREGRGWRSAISKETLEFKDRERFLAGAIEYNYLTYKVLQQMGVEGRAKLSQETKRTDDLILSLKVQFEAFEKKFNEDRKILARLPGRISEEKEIKERKEKLAKIEEENKNLGEQIEESRRRKKEVLSSPAFFSLRKD